MIRLSHEQKLAWGRREIALIKQTRPKSHEEVMAAMETRRIHRDSIGATHAEVKQMIEDAEKADAISPLPDNKPIVPDKPPYWAFTHEGRSMHCNYCAIQFYTRQDFSKHWNACPARIRAGYIEPAIYAS